GVDAVAGDLAVDFGAAGERVVEAFERVERAALGNDDAVAVAVKGTRGLLGVGVGGEGVLGFEAREDAEGVNAFADAAADRQVHLAEAKHLRGVDQAEVAGGAGRADGVGRAGGAEVQGGLAGGVVGDGARVVVVRPILGVVVELGDGVDLVLGLHVAVLGAADVDADAVLAHRVQIDAAVGDGLAGAVDRDGAGARADAEFLLFLILE